MDNIYSTPKSQVIEIDKSTVPFERFSTWYVVGLSIITLSLYVPYWLYTRTKQLNGVVENTISEAFVNSVLGFYILSFAMVIPVSMYEGNTEIELLSSIVDLVANILILVWVYKFRNRLVDEIFKNRYSLGNIITFFFQIYYLQYKINEYIDESEDHLTSTVEGQS
ncbi:DUF4234 domain-containing protein [Aurantivibrio plasticivorans]